MVSPLLRSGYFILLSVCYTDCSGRGFSRPGFVCGSYCMLKSILATIVLSTFVGAAYAPCPLGTKFTCTQGFDGKFVCGCQ
jgi:hypothetical protein